MASFWATLVAWGRPADSPSPQFSLLIPQKLHTGVFSSPIMLLLLGTNLLTEKREKNPQPQGFSSPPSLLSASLPCVGRPLSELPGWTLFLLLQILFYFHPKTVQNEETKSRHLPSYKVSLGLSCLLISVPGLSAGAYSLRAASELPEHFPPCFLLLFRGEPGDHCWGVPSE